jgi:hypothetical protein
MNKSKIIILGVVCALVIIQFIRPDRNYTGQVSTESLTALYHPPDSIRRILQQSCMDCHSNNTVYPWYTNVQPIGWILNRHIRHGKDELNLDQFSRYSERRKISKLRSMKDQVRDGVMPLKSYTFMHADARLSKAQKQLLIHWLGRQIDSLNQ